jgi:hypothetical protein
MMFWLNIFLGLIVLCCSVYILTKGIKTFSHLSRGKKTLYFFDLADLLSTQTVYLDANKYYAIFYEGERRQSTSLLWQPFISTSTLPERQLRASFFNASYHSFDRPSRQTITTNMFKLHVPSTNEYKLVWKLTDLGWKYPITRWLAKDQTPPQTGSIKVLIAETTSPLQMLWIPFGMYFGIVGLIASVFVMSGFYMQLIQKYHPNSVLESFLLQYATP